MFLIDVTHPPCQDSSEQRVPKWGGDSSSKSILLLVKSLLRLCIPSFFLVRIDVFSFLFSFHILVEVVGSVRALSHKSIELPADLEPSKDG